MAEETINKIVRTCDHCRREEVSSHKDFGDVKFKGWWVVKQTPMGRLSPGIRKHFCCLNCLQNWTNDPMRRFDHEEANGGADE